MLEISGLTKRYGNGTVALSDFTLTLGEGVLGLLGPNGAGKTTLMSIVATVLRPTAGTVRWRGADALADPLAIRRELGLPAAGLRRLRQAHRRRAAALLRPPQGARRARS
jgi:ABC-type multidrug transport system ATPase subunit